MSSYRAAAGVIILMLLPLSAPVALCDHDQNPLSTYHSHGPLAGHSSFSFAHVTTRDVARLRHAASGHRHVLDRFQHPRLGRLSLVVSTTSPLRAHLAPGLSPRSADILRI